MRYQLETQSTQINTRIKEDLVKLKKELKTAKNLHVYYKMLLKRKLNHFHQHVNQQKYSQIKNKNKNSLRILLDSDQERTKKYY